MKSFQLGKYKDLAVRGTSNVTAKDVEMNEAIRLVSMELEDDEKPLLGELLPLLKETIEAEKTRLLPYAQMDCVIAAVAEQSRYEFDDEELNALADNLCDDFIADLTQSRGVELREYFSLRNITPRAFMEECRLEASRRLLTEAVLDSVAEAEGIVVTPQEQERAASRGECDPRAQLRAKTMAKLLEYNLPEAECALS